MITPEISEDNTITLKINPSLSEAVSSSFADTTSTLSASVRGILIDTGACLAAIEGISFDMSGFTSRVEAEDMINVLRDIALRNLSILRDKKTQEFMKNA